ncbi:MAG: adenosylcobinamide-GDP ribazoletransferase [Leptolyngbyaceae cyanobacterium MO_188.B28]|nr:adenosylcobinamide-GDP ribazoletransferase [Leptolyngbyaceae cyanobacterium MO_188.B28]
MPQISDQDADPRLSPPLRSRLDQWRAQWAGAIAFYTCLPVARNWTLEFRRIARWAPLVGLLIGGLLALGDGMLARLDTPILTRSGILVLVWIGLTGGLHLDGAIDAADGLAVLDPQRRLEVMADSRTGAFGTMAAIALMGLKTIALSDLTTSRWLALMTVAGWGRWAQVVAISHYPYLKPTGKGAFHKQSIQSPQDWLLGLGILLGLSGLQLARAPHHWRLTVGGALGGIAIAILVAAWFNQKLGGHTGDTYGAVVEWTEALLLCLMTVLQ